MKNTKKMVLSSLLAPILYGSVHKTEARFMDHFKDMVQAQQKMLQDMETQFNDFAKEFDDLFVDSEDQTKQIDSKKESVDMQIAHDDSFVTITFKNITTDADKIESPVQDNRLDIVIPHNEQTTKLSIIKQPHIDTQVLTVETKHEARSENNKDQQEKKASYYCYSSSRNQQFLPAVVNLENSEIEYNEAEKQLIIKLPKKVVKRIAVVKK